MGRKLSSLDKIILRLIDDMTVLDLKRAHTAETIAMLKAQQTARPVRTPKAKKEPVTP